MAPRSKSQQLVLLTLFCLLFSQTLGRSPYEALRPGDITPLEEANEPDKDSLEAQVDIFQNVLDEASSPYYDASRSARHVDGVFTNDYVNHLSKLNAKKFLKSVIGKRESNDFSEETGPVKRQADAIFTDRYTSLRSRLALKKYLQKYFLNGKLK